MITQVMPTHGIAINKAASREIAKRSRGSARLATKRFARWVADYCSSQNVKPTVPTVRKAFAILDIDENGLAPRDHAFLRLVRDEGPVGLGRLGSTLGESEQTILDSIEPYLIQKGLVRLGPKGREITEVGIQHLKGG